MDKYTCAILIPIYRKSFNDLEKISFDRVRTVLKDYDIIAVTPRKLKGKLGLEMLQECFEDSDFKSISSYSRLLLSKDFYQRFLKYEYILIYQLDAFVFSDRLEYFCNMGYDYIGAPWIDGMMSKRRDKICFVGNGGLTLRKVKAAISLIERCGNKAKEFSENEDLFFSLHRANDYRVAPVKVALAFSIESKVERCFRMNKREIPFGCHAWEKYNYYFWKPYIEKYGYNINEEYIDNGDMDKKIACGIIRKLSMWLYRFVIGA